MSNRHHGSCLDDFLKDAGAFEATQALALKEVVVWQQAEARQQRSLTKTQLASKQKRPEQNAQASQPNEEFGRRDWTRTNDPHHVKVVL